MAYIKLKTRKRIVNQSLGVKKLKSKSGAKKRFRFTATGLVVATQANKGHNMLKRSRRQLKVQRGTVILANNVAKVIKKFFNLTK
jgi:large subunit ribosomal protein L35